MKLGHFFGHCETSRRSIDGSSCYWVWILTVSAQLADGAGPQQARDQDRQPEGVPRQETVAEVWPGHQVSWGHEIKKYLNKTKNI